MKKAASVDAYIAKAPKEVRGRLVKLRAAIRSVAPKAEEKLSYGMPYYGYKGRLAYFAVAKHHVGLYIPPPVIAQHAKELKKYHTATATVRFPNAKPLPLALIKKLVRARVKVNEGKKGAGATGGTKKYEHYHKDGTLWGRGALGRGKMHGYWEWFRKDGKKLRSGSFDKGKQVGEWITYKDGKPHKVTRMKAG